MTHQRSITLIASDFHMGGGAVDRGDDFVYQDAAFERFIEEQLATPAGRSGDIELILNGDTFELAQVRAELYTLGSAQYWCSEDESLAKLEYILAGHSGFVEALRRFVAAGNALTLAPGNHDVELYWQAVRTTIETAVGGPVRFELGSEWYTRYDGKLAIAHGHMFDPANRFEHWSQPILDVDEGAAAAAGKSSTTEKRLEMCPGTLFMVKFVNPLEDEYPFADNLHPVTAIADILARDKKSRLAPVVWMLLKFAARHRRAILETGIEGDDYDVALRRQLLTTPRRFNEFAEAYRTAVDPAATDAQLRARIATTQGLVDVFLDLCAALPLDRWLSIASVPSSTLAIESGGDDEAPAGTLSINESNRQKTDEVLREAATKRFAAGARFVVMGHTHQPDHLVTPAGEYFNTGSWTRYVNAANIGLLTLDDLKSEQNFPYQLNYVRIERGPDGQVTGRMIAFDQRTGFRFGQRLNL